jgi:transposase, IS6 family
VSDFKERPFEGEIVLWAVRWYCRCGVSYRDLEQVMGERGVSVDHSTVYRWVRRHVPAIEKRLRWQWHRPRSTGWRTDETYVKLCGKWALSLSIARQVWEYHRLLSLADAQHERGETLPRRGADGGLKEWEKRKIISTDKAPIYAAAHAELKKDGRCPDLNSTPAASGAERRGLRAAISVYSVSLR